MRTVLYVLGLVGILGTWGRTAVDGTLVNLFYALHGADEYVLPGSKAVLRKNFTGIYWPIDYLLNVLVIFFWEAVDGSHPAASAIAFAQDRGLGLVSSGLLPAPKSLLDHLDTHFLPHRPTLWLLSFQMCALGCTGFVWALAYTSSSPTTSRSLSSNALQSASLLPPQMTLLIFPALIFGYVVPTILMALPSPGIVTNNFQQLAVVVWNLYPMLVLVILKVFTSMLSGLRNDQSASSPREHLRSVRLISCLSLIMSSAVHIGVSAVSTSTALFPTIFTAKYAQELSPGRLILPPLSIFQGGSVGDGVRSFFWWDQVAAYPIVILVMMLELHTAVVARGLPTNRVKSAGMAVMISCIAGPGSACLALSWLRDEILFGEIEESSRLFKMR
ncbi:MAG: hypothetical protein Q9217_006162 [Psora testacea]